MQLDAVGDNQADASTTVAPLLNGMSLDKQLVCLKQQVLQANHASIKYAAGIKDEERRRGRPTAEPESEL